MEVKVLGNTIILQEAIVLDVVNYLVRVDCIDKGEDESPYTISQYAIANGTMYEIDNMDALNPAILRLIGKLVTMVHGGIYKTEYGEVTGNH